MDEWFAGQLVFIRDPQDDNNRPVQGHHDNATVWWPLIPALFS